MNGIWGEDPSKVKLEIRNFFLERFGEKERNRLYIDRVNLSQISLEEKKKLEARFEEEEIKEVAWDCESSKSPGPNGFYFKFITAFRNTLKGDIIKFIHEFHMNGVLPKGCNSSFIALIPKIDDPQNLGDYRPISLVDCMYKILAKLLARRIKGALTKVIDKRQSVFLEGRNLFHSVLVENEPVDEARRRKKKCLVFKVNYEKAYDSISWDFLFYMLRRLGLGVKWIGWIKQCLTKTHISILVNGSPIDEFSPQRVLRQGDPLAPFLFTIVAEGLCDMMKEAFAKDLFQGFLVGRDGIEINLLQYVDDILFSLECYI